jgi:hypothetical protein
MRRAWKSPQTETEEISILPRQPDLNVIGLARAEADIAAAQVHHAIVQTKALHDRFGAAEHALMLVDRFLGGSDRHHLNLVELVLAQHAARIAPGRTRFRAEAWG